MSEKRDLPQKTGAHPVELHNQGLKAGSLVEQALSNLTPEQKQALMGKAGEEALRLEVKARELQIDAAEGKKALEDHVDAFNMLDKQGKLTRQTVKSDIKTGAGKMSVESKSGMGCFVASVAYGDSNHPDVVFLREYRDGELVKKAWGRAFIRCYGRYGPSLAEWTSNKPFVRAIAKSSISALVHLLQKDRRAAD